MNRGDVWQLDVGGHAGRRPAGILTRQGVIPHLNKLTVAEITSQTRFLKYLGTLDAATMQTVGRKLILALGLEDCV